jgi:hypothetical protein
LNAGDVRTGLNGRVGLIKIEIEVGQIYSFHMDPNESWLLLTSDETLEERKAKFLTIMEVNYIGSKVGVTVLKDKTGLFVDGERFKAKEQDIQGSGHYRLIWVPKFGKTAKVEEYGINCTKCKRYYPDAVVIDDFKCWGCENGY